MNIKVLTILLMALALFPQQKSRSVLHAESLDYPRLLLLAQIQGEVTVHAEVEADGRVRSALFISGLRPLADAAIDNVLAWRFEPGEKEYVDVSYRFVLMEPKVLDPHTTCKFDLPNTVTVISNLPVPETSSTH
jgi:hypothetical protein